MEKVKERDGFGRNDNYYCHCGNTYRRHCNFL